MEEVLDGPPGVLSVRVGGVTAAAPRWVGSHNAQWRHLVLQVDFETRGVVK